MEKAIGSPYLEALVLENALDCSVLAAGRQFGLKDDTEGAIADDLALGVLHLFRLASESILNLFANDFCKKNDNISQEQQQLTRSAVGLHTCDNDT